MSFYEPALGIPFDSFERYSMTAGILRALLGDDSAPAILDVGGSSGALKHFVPGAHVVVADPKEPPPHAFRETVPFRADRYVRALGGQLPFGDASFDIVTAHDTLEHVPPAGRESFLEDVLRIADRFVILNGPIWTPETEAAERRLGVFWERALEWDDHALLEHLENGLPREEVIVEVLERSGKPFIRIPNGNLMVWLATFALKYYVGSLPNSYEIHELLDRTFNGLVAKHDLAEPTYRVAHVVAKRGEDREALEHLEGSRESWFRGPSIGEGIDGLEPLLSGLEAHAVHVRRLIRGFENGLEASRTEAGSWRKTAAKMEGDLRAAGLWAEELQDLISDREAEIRWLQANLDEARTGLEETRAALAEIRGSAGYRIGQGLVRRANRFLPSRDRGPGGWLRRRVHRSLERRARTAPVEASPEPSIEPGTDRSSDDARYRDWIQRVEPGVRELEEQRASAENLPSRPLLSVVVPVWNPDPDGFREMLESVRDQTYPYWELCVADGRSHGNIRAILKEFADVDDRIRAVFLDENEGISGNTNAALDLAGGDFVAFVDQTDVLAPFALFEVAKAVNADPSVDVLHSDFDLLSEDGERRFNPFFTPEWSPHLLLSSNYMAHLLVIRRERVEEVGRLSSDYDGAQDWDLLFRVTERTDRIRRIPAILYHWRADAGSAALSLEAKPEAERRQRAAVQHHLDRTGADATVVRGEDGHLRLAWGSERRPTVSVIIPTRHNRDLLRRCLAGIARSDYPGVDVIVIESAERTREREAWYEGLREQRDLRVLWWESDFNYSAVNNLGAREATGEILVFLNDDTEPLDPGWLDEIVGWLGSDGVGVVGAQLEDADGRIQHGGVVIGMRGFAEHLFRGMRPGEWSLLGSTRWYRDVSAVTGACLAIRRDRLQALGGWNERFVLNGSDIELCLRAGGEGDRVVVSPFVRVLHDEGVTRGRDLPEADFSESFWHYQQHLFNGDPYFNPGLSYEDPVPALAMGPRKTFDVVSGAVGRPLGPRGEAKADPEVAMLAEACRISPADRTALRDVHASITGFVDVGTINWYIPDYENPFYGGIHTIFRFADHYLRAHGVKSRFVIVGTGPETFLRSGLENAFPQLGDAEILFAHEAEEEGGIPPADASIASLWTTAYPMMRARDAGRRFYLVQDFEPMFYPAGGLYALAEETYRFGLYGICNTPSLSEIYESYGNRAVTFMPQVDAGLFHADRPPRKPDDPLTVFLYGRPGHPRNCYELAIGALGRLKRSLGDRVRIVAAGAWGGGSPEDAWIEQLGLLRYEDTAELYRRCDAGLVLSVSKHPTYIPLQLMASGALVVANRNPANGWLLRDEENCLLAEASVDALAAALERGLTEDDLRDRLTGQALSDVRAGHSDWEPEMDKVFRFLCDPR